MRLMVFAGVAMSAMLAHATAAPGKSVYTSIASKDCRWDRVGNEPGDSEDQTKRCRGLAGARVVVNAFHTVVRLRFEWPAARRKSETPYVIAPWSIGEKLEWRGAATGAFRPDAVIVRALYNKDGERAIERQVLAVIRFRQGGACLMGAVDMTADKTPYETAQKLADDRAASFTCGKDTPVVVGPPTRWTAALIESATKHD